MIDFRYHIVSIVAIFFALGAGVLLGAGPLKSNIPNTVIEQADRDRKALEQTRAQLIQARVMDKYRDEYISKVASVDVDGRLKDRTVTLVVLPGASSTALKGITDMLARAGSQVTTKVTVAEKALASSQRQLVDQLNINLAQADVTFPNDSTSYQRLGLLLARAVGATREGAPVDDKATAIRSGLASSKLFSFDPAPTRRSSLVVVVAGDTADPVPAGNSYNDAVDLVQGLDAGSAGAVLAGTVSSATNGLLKAFRGDSDATSRASSVDASELPSGQLTVVFALVEQASDKAGQYGAVGAKNGIAPKAMLVPGR